MTVPTDNVNLTNLDAGTDSPASARADLHNFGSLISNIISALGGGGATAWNSTNDGAGSGLDADLLDGQHGSYYTSYTDTKVNNAVGFVGWQLSDGVYTTSSNYLSYPGFIKDIKFSSDGMKMYILTSVYTIRQYSLLLPWDSRTFSYDSISLDVSAHSPSGMFFKPDGTKMYLCSTANDAVYQYSLPTAWVLTGGSYDSISLDVSAQAANASTLAFKPDGTKMYVLNEGTDIVYQYSLPTAWVLTGGSYDSISLDVSAQETQSTSMFIRPDGEKLYIVGQSNNTVYQYSLPTAWVLTGGSYDSISLDVSAQETQSTSMFFKPDGTKMYLAGLTNNFIYQYATCRAYPIS